MDKINRHQNQTHTHRHVKKEKEKKKICVSSILLDNSKARLSDYIFTNRSKSFPKQRISDSSELKVFADNNYTFDKNGRKSSKRIEKTVGKGEIARYEHFLLFPQCFLKTYTADTQKQGLVWERVNTLNLLPHNDDF